MNEYRIAKYIRLSMDDAISDSLSISNQHLLLDKHIDTLDIPGTTVLSFVDNGYTGTNINRPQLQRLIESVRCGEIDCILVKDFSRFSRSVLESGYYIEQVFPLYNVRFISVGDHFDSSDYKDSTGGLDVAFKFLMNEYYSKDLSNKIKSSLHVRMKNGKHIVANAVYGYRKNDSGKWEPDPKPAEVVRQIFQMATEGMSTSQIRDKMFEAKYPTPKEYQEMKRGKEIALKYKWGTLAVYRILTNEQYTGSYVAGRRETTRINAKSCTSLDRSKWIIIPDKHPAIVSKEDFARVQDMLKAPKEFAAIKPAPSKHSQLLRSRAANGMKISPFALYGYAKTEGGAWVIDEVSAQVVKSIFDMTLNGLSTWQISDRLFEAGYPTPSEYFKLTKGQSIEPTNRWQMQNVRNIIKNEAYTGVFISGKTFLDDSGKKCHAPKSEWIVIPDKHPAIISKDMFDKVQKVFEENKRKNMRRREYLLYGKVSCGCCGYALSFNDTSTINKYSCTNTRHDPTAMCHKMSVNAHEIEDVIMTAIRKQAEVVLANDDLSTMHRINADAKQITECEKQIRHCVEQLQGHYEQYMQDEIDYDTFKALKSECSKKRDKLNNYLALLKQSERDEQSKRKVSSLAQKAIEQTSSPQDIVNTLVERVYVSPDNSVGIKWKFANFASGKE